ncbi:MAG TPA: hypothetical protein VFA05_07970 [Gaiellaceae bacterium]|nr:hypothetical protein [Gaiellaceae bacterium]
MLPALLVLAGCGGGGGAKTPAQTVRGPGYRFAAPAGWKVARTATATAAARDSELVQVSTFPLVRAYSDALFAAVSSELQARMRQVARQSGGSVTGRFAVTAAGIRSHAYDVDVGDHVDEYTFVLRGKREYLLLCRRKKSSRAGFCTQLVRTFALA